MAVLSAGSSMEDGIKAAQQGHRNYAKRQLTWFRREPDVHWIAAFGNDADAVQAAAALVKAAI
jgi:tRNA dimethylallyltransferase